ncbi:hypothetical protein A3K78_09350 [Candidatus Bathyarchaeota archaeon RBG_13_52_12]|nr:MAG: hypothetical protein A3K78_09350 [Candidatus Bathyarchaeota archaeon RBG_13_52_12]
MTDLIRAYTMPDKFAVDLPIDKIVCDENIDYEYVQKLAGEMDASKLKPIVVIKHPNKELYAVLDGHHRFKAARLKGLNKIKAAIIDDYVGLGFELTRQGVFQPSPDFTKYVRLPLKRFIEYMQNFLLA